MLKPPGYIPRRTLLYTAALIAADADGLKTSVASAITVQTYTGGAINGALDESKLYMRVPTVTTSAQAGAYNTSDFIQFVGVAATGRERIVKVLLTQVDGGETVSPLDANNTEGIGIDKLTSIIVPAQLTALGAFTFGVAGGAIYDKDDQAVRVRNDDAGNELVQMEEAGGDQVVLNLSEGQLHECLWRKLIATSTTSTNFAVML